MPVRLYKVFLVVALLFSFSSHALSLEAFHHEYKSTFAGFSAKTTRTLSKTEDGVWELKMTARNLFAKYEETSRFRLDDQGYPIPMEHKMDSRVFGSKRSEHTDFDWQEGTATWSRKDDVRTGELSSGMIDRILFQILIPMDAASGIQKSSYSFINRGEIKEYDFERMDDEEIKIGDKAFNTIKMRRIDEEKETTVWIAPELNYEIVKLHHLDDDGADYKMEIKL